MIQVLPQKSYNGFALLEILLVGVLFSGLIYLFVTFNKNKTSQLTAEKTGTHLAALVNDVISISKTYPVTGAVTKPLTDVVPLSNDMKTELMRDGFDIDQSTIAISAADYSSPSMQVIHLLEIQIVLSGSISSTEAILYTPFIINGLSPLSLASFNAEALSTYGVISVVVRTPNQSEASLADTGELAIFFTIKKQ